MNDISSDWYLSILSYEESSQTTSCQYKRTKPWFFDFASVFRTYTSHEDIVSSFIFSTRSLSSSTFKGPSSWFSAQEKGLGSIYRSTGKAMDWFHPLCKCIDFSPSIKRKIVIISGNSSIGCQSFFSCSSQPCFKWQNCYLVLCCFQHRMHHHWSASGQWRSYWSKGWSILSEYQSKL